MTPRGPSGLMWIISSAFASGVMAPVGKLAVAQISSGLFNFYMNLFAAFLGFGLLKLRGESLRDGFKRDLRPTLLLNTACVAIALWSLWEGMRHLHPAIAAFVSNTQVVFTVVFAAVVLRNPLRASMVPALILVLCGLGIMNLSKLDAAFGEISTYGFLMVMLSAATFAAGDIVVKRVVHRMPLLPYLTVRNIILSLIFGAVCLASRTRFHMDLQVTALVFLCAFLGPLMARFTFNAALRTLDVGPAIIGFQMYPLFALTFGYLILGDLPSKGQIGGGLVIIAGVIWLAKAKNNTPAKT